MEKKKKKYIIVTLSIIGLILLVIGVTYAYWILTKEQTGENIVNSACLNITFTGENDINLDKAYPMTDEQLDKFLSKATPYHFTIHNECDDLANATINLESLNAGTEKQLQDEYINAILYETDYHNNLNSEKKLSAYNDENKVLKESIHAYQLYNFTLQKGETKSFNLQLYMDSNTPRAEENMNATWKGKITLSANYKEETFANIGGKKVPITEIGDGLYEVKHDDLEELGSEWNKTEYRYAGADPNNYVSFNDEIWRIIGLVNVKVGESVEQRIKIVRTDGVKDQKDFGNYAWDRDDSQEYTNNWTTSKLKDMLNGIYYESGTGECYTGDNGNIVTQNICDFSGNGDQLKGLDDGSKNMIDKDVIWNLGGWVDSRITVKQLYEKERGTSTGNSNAYPSEWSNETDVGEKHNGIGLVYPSDYGYATNGGSIGRNACFDKVMYDWDSLSGNYRSECGGKDWLTPINNALWSLFSNSSDSSHSFIASISGFVSSTDGIVYNSYIVLPTLYLTNAVNIISGEGTLEEPYELQLNA